MGHIMAKNGLIGPIVGTACAAALATTLLAPVGTAGAAPAPAATAVVANDIAAVGAACPQFYAYNQKTREVGTLVGGDGSFDFYEHTRITIDPISSASLAGTVSRWKDADGEQESRYGRLFIDKRGNAVYLRTVDGDQLASPVRVSGHFTGLRHIVDTGTTGNVEKDQERDTMLYGVTTTGTLVKMPVSWGRNGIPSFGKQQVVARGFGAYSDIQFAAWKGVNWVPTEDRLVAVTTAGRLVEITVTRARTPKVTTKVLIETRLKNVVGLSNSMCWDEPRAVEWIVQPAAGAAVEYKDPEFFDSSFKGVKKTTLYPVPRGITTF